MRTIDGIWFWYFLLGFILGGGAIYLWVTLKEKGIRLVWYEWILSVLSFLILILLGQTFIASFKESEPQAAWMSLLFMGLPALLLAIGTFRSIQLRVTKSR